MQPKKNKLFTYLKINNYLKKATLVINKIKGQLRLTFTDKIYLSFGENCLTDNILDRHKLKSFTTPFSHGRSNIEYILQLEKDSYKDFLNNDYLRYEETDDKMVVPRLKKYDQLLNSYNDMHMNGFEFTHHDVIKNENLKLKFQKRVTSLRKYIGKKKYIILYNHRISGLTNRAKLIADLQELKQIYSAEKKPAVVVLYRQQIIPDLSERKLEYQLEGDIHVFTFYTLDAWSGSDDEKFWARCDDDLVKKMIGKIKEF